MSIIKGRSGKDLKETEEIKKRWQNEQNYTKKVFTTQIITML